MLARTFAFVQQLVAPLYQGRTTAEDDRRLWARYPADLHARIHLTNDRGADQIPAVVRELSCGGANLILETAPKAGQVFRLELKEKNGSSRVIAARVIRCTNLDEREWSVGCEFTREISTEDLEAIGAQKAQAAQGDKRAWIRFPGELQAKCRKYGHPENVSKSVTVLDVSANGIGLVVPPAFGVGTLLHVDLFNNKGRKVCGILARIVRTAKQAGGKQAAGCTFVRELSDKELDSLL